MNARRSVVLLVVAAVVGTVSTAYCLDPATHMDIARNSLDAWQSFDPQFYSVITGNPQDDYGRWFKKMTLKLYLIGVSLPDLFWSGQQSAASDLLAYLHSERGWMVGDWPLDIEDETYDSTRTPMSFPGHHSLDTLYHMALLAKSQCTDAREKALVYGAYFHAIEDRYGDMAVQPSRFGYGYALYPDISLAYPAPDPMEQYHELFAGTHITAVDYQAIDFLLFWGVQRWSTDTLLPYGDKCFALEFYREVNGIMEPTKTWQTTTFPAITKFCQLANSYGGNLSHDKLRAYIHAWAIALGLGYG